MTAAPNFKPGFEEVPCHLLSLDVVGDVGNRLEERCEAESKVSHDQDAEQDASGHEQHRLDDLHPGCGKHSTKDHVDDHQDAYADYRHVEADAWKQQFNQGSCADHLGDHVEGGYCDRAQRGHRANRTLLQAISQKIGHGVLSGISEWFGDDDQNSQIGHEPADRVHEAVIAKEGDHARNSQEACGAHIVARHRKAVLPAGDSATGCEISAGTRGFSRAEIGDDQSRRDKGQKHQECRGLLGRRCGKGKEAGHAEGFFKGNYGIGESGNSEARATRRRDSDDCPF